MISFLNKFNLMLQQLSFLGPLTLRIFLFFPFYMAGAQKLGHIEDTAYWFEHSLNLPFPLIMAYLAGLTEYLGAFLLLIGLATRLTSIPLIITMLVAIFAVHWDNGWAAIASSADPGISERLDAARYLLKEHGNYNWLTEKGSFVILNNGIEFAVTYTLMLFVLLSSGAGKFVSVDYWIGRRFNQSTDNF